MFSSFFDDLNYILFFFNAVFLNNLVFCSKIQHQNIFTYITYCCMYMYHNIHAQISLLFPWIQSDIRGRKTPTSLLDSIDEEQKPSPSPRPRKGQTDDHFTRYLTNKLIWAEGITWYILVNAQKLTDKFKKNCHIISWSTAEAARFYGTKFAWWPIIVIYELKALFKLYFKTVYINNLHIILQTKTKAQSAEQCPWLSRQPGRWRRWWRNDFAVSKKGITSWLSHG